MSNNLRTRNGLPFNFVNGLRVRGQDIESLIPGIEGIPEAGSKYQYAGNGTNKIFTLPVSPYNKDAIDVHVKQLYVHPNDYELVGDTVTLADAPPALSVGETHNVVIKVSLTTLNGYVNANRVSFEGELLDVVLQKSKPLANYVTLRAYAGASSQVHITDPGVEGLLYYDSTDTVSTDNGGTVIVSANGRRWKRHINGPVNVKWFGAKGDGVTDDTVAIQAALSTAHRVIYFPSVNSGYRVTSTLRVESSKVIKGDGTVPMTAYSTSRSAGSWLYFDHTGVGIRFGNVDASGFYTGSEITGLGSYRNQPAASGVGWVPFNHEFDVDVVNSDLTIDNYHLYNATNGIRLRNGSTGRLNCYNIRGFPLNTGIQIYESYDLCRIENIHFWPFYGISNEGIWNYVLNNGVGIHLLRVDNPLITNIFTIFYRDGVLIDSHPTAGPPNKVKILNADLDRGRNGIRINSTANGHVGQYVNISSQGESPGPSSGSAAGIDGNFGAGLHVQASNCHITMTNVDFREHRSNAIRIEGTSNWVTVAQLKVDHPDTAGIGFPAVEAATNNTLEILGKPLITRTGVGGKYSPTGVILVDEWRAFTPTVSTTIGTIGSITFAAGLYKVVADAVKINVNFTVGVNGTGAGTFVINIPFGSPIGASSGAGREVSVAGKGIILTVRDGSGTIELTNYDNTYPGVDNGNYVGSVEYRINTNV